MIARLRHRPLFPVLVCAALLFFAGDSFSRQSPLVDASEPQPELENLPPQSDGGRTNFNIVFHGARSFDENAMRDAIEEQIKSIQEFGLNPARANDTAFFLALFYLKHGYSQVQVTEQITGRQLILNVREGPLTTLGKTTFIGNTAFDSETLRSYLIGATRERVSRFKAEEELPFVETDIKTGASRIKSLYLSEGYLDVEVVKPEIDYSPGYTKASVALQITEGTKYTIGKPVIYGHIKIFKDKDTDRIEKLTSQYVGKPFTPQKIVNLRRSLVYEYKKEGYFNATIEESADPANAVNGVVPVFFTVNAGPVYTFDGAEFNMKPDGRLKRSFLENRFRALNGKTYNPEEVDELFRELMQTGLFTQLRITPIEVPGDEVKLKVSVDEAKAKELGLALGYGTYEGPFVGASYTERNLFGTGRPISFFAEFSTRTYRGEIRYTDRWFLETQNQLNLNFSALTFDFDSYDIFEIGALAEIGRDLTDHWRVTTFIRPKKGEVTSSQIDSEFLGPTSYFVNSVGFSNTIDYRDSALNPKKGFVFGTTFDFANSALGSEIDFVRALYRFSIYHTVGPVLLAAGARGGIISPIGNTDLLPINERFFTGGSRSVRSFNERKLGPKDKSGDPIGGQTYLVYNIEVVFPLIGGFEGAIFFDAGSVGRKVSDGFGELRYGIGGGLRYPLPIGPLRLDYGINPSPKANESSGAFHFSFGFAF